jgi:putative SOS response-associated peptidase YedK
MPIAGRCIVPVDGFFEWRAAKSGNQPYAIAMKDGAPFGIGGLWENWREPSSGEWIRTLAIITVPANRSSLKSTTACRRS